MSGRSAVRGFLFVVLTLLAVTPLHAGDEPDDAALRRDFDALIRRIEDGPQPDADSPTALVDRLVAAGDAKLRPVLEEAWRIGGSGRRHYFPLRWAIALLYDKLPVFGWDQGDRTTAFQTAGALQIQMEDGRGSFCGNCNEAATKAIPFASLVEGGRLIELPRVRVEALIDALRSSGDWDDDLARAAGEACAAMAVPRQRLLELAARPDAAPSHLIAAGWTRSKEAIPVLQEALAREASKEAELQASSRADGVDRSERDVRRCLVAACNALTHVDPRVLTAALAQLDGAAEDAALWAAGVDAAAPAFDRWIDGAKDAAARAAALHRIAGVLDREGGPLDFRGRRTVSGYSRDPSGAVLTRLTRRFGALAADPDPDVSKAALAALQPLLRSPSHVGVDYGSQSAAGVLASKKTLIRPYPSARVAASQSCDDLASGRATRTDPRWTSVFEETSSRDPFIAKVSGPIASGETELPVFRSLNWEARWAGPLFEIVTDEGESSDLRLRAAIVKDAIQAKLTNLRTDPLALDVVALQHVDAELLDESFTDKAGKVSTWRALHLLLGALEPDAVTSAKALVTLAKGESYAWSIPLRPEDRDVDHLGLSLVSRPSVDGEADTPVVRMFDTVWIR